MIVGIDEVGLGAWAGPLVVCAFAAHSESWIVPGLDDSKKLGKTVRNKLGKDLMRQYNGDYSLVQVEASDIDQYGIAKMLPFAMERALENLIESLGIPDRVIIDGDPKGLHGAEYFPRADGEFPCVMAASVIAKVYRDDLMVQHAVTHPQYGFDSHVGYGTKRHARALEEYGVCDLHRRSYKPIESFTSVARSLP